MFRCTWNFLEKKNSINKPDLLKTHVEWFQAVTIKTCTSRGVFRGSIVPCPHPPLANSTKQKSTKDTLKSRNQIIKRTQVEKADATWHFRIILINLRVEEAQISEFLVHAIILPL